MTGVWMLTGGRAYHARADKKTKCGRRYGPTRKGKPARGAYLSEQAAKANGGRPCERCWAPRGTWSP